MPTSDIEHWPRLTRFYKISPFELARLPNGICRVYIDALPGLQAEEQLFHMQASDFPHLTSEGRDRLHKRLVVAAGFGTVKEVTISPTSEAMQAVGLRIGVTRESMSGKAEVK